MIPSGPYTLPGLMPNVISGRVANMFELNGPNVVIDMGSNSLFQSLMVARDFLMHGECKAVLAGGLTKSYACLSYWPQRRANGHEFERRERRSHFRLGALGCLLCHWPSCSRAAAPAGTWSTTVRSRRV